MSSHIVKHVVQSYIWTSIMNDERRIISKNADLVSMLIKNADTALPIS